MRRTMLIVLALTVGLGLIAGCESMLPVEPMITEADEAGTNEGVKFIEPLEIEVEFPVDEETGELIPLDGVNIPESEQELYKLFLEQSEIPEGAQTRSALSNYWRYAVYREICYALSRTRYHQGRWGQSTRIYEWHGRWFAGDWNYRGLGKGIGGNCKSFGSTIVKRATGNRYDLPSGYNYAHGNIAWCRPGDVIQRSNSYGTQHTAIVFCVIARDGYGRATLIDVIDSNFIGGMGRKLIARHKFPFGSYHLYQFKVW